MTLEQARELEDAEKRLKELQQAAGLPVSEKSNGPVFAPAGKTEAKPLAAGTPAALKLEQTPAEWAKGIEARVSAMEVSVRDAVQRAWAETEKMRDIIRAELQRIRVAAIPPAWAERSTCESCRGPIERWGPHREREDGWGHVNAGITGHVAVLPVRTGVEIRDGGLVAVNKAGEAIPAGRVALLARAPGRCDRCKSPLVLMPGGVVAHAEGHGKVFDHEPLEEIPF